MVCETLALIWRFNEGQGRSWKTGKESTLCIFKRQKVHNLMFSFFFLNFGNCKDSAQVINFDLQDDKMGLLRTEHNKIV